MIVTHPIQYHVPLYLLLSQRDDLDLRVFYTWHGGEKQMWDSGFRQPVAWDIPLTDGYDFEVVPNTSRHPGSHHFWGLRNPTLATRVLHWRPDIVHVTGYSYASHLGLMRTVSKSGIPILFRGDSHLLSPATGIKKWLKLQILSRVYRYPAAFLCVGRHNRDYYRACDVPQNKLVDCPHSIETDRFLEPNDQYEHAAMAWRRELGISDDTVVILFAGKFQTKKEPIALMQAFGQLHLSNVVLLMLGNGELENEVSELASRSPRQFRVLPFQNQARMPVVYRLGDLLVLPSSREETWGLAVNESLACGRPALVSDQVGCAPELIVPLKTGQVFRSGDWCDFGETLLQLIEDPVALRGMREEARSLGSRYSISTTASALVRACQQVLGLESTTPQLS